MNSINMREKNNIHPSLYPFLLLCLWSLTLPLEHTHIHTHKHLRSICVSFFFFFCEMFDRLHRCKKNEVGVRERQNGWDLRKERGRARRENKRLRKRAKHTEWERERGKERWREQVFSLSTCHFTDPRYERQKHRGEITKKEDVYYQTTLFLSLYLTLFLFIISLSLSLFLPKQVFKVQSNRDTKGM